MAVMHFQKNPKRQRYNMWNGCVSDPYLDVNCENENAPWRQGKYYANGPVGLHSEINDFYVFIRPTEPECLMRQDVVKRIQMCINKEWPKAKVEVFGSSRTRLFLPTSDIDIVVVGEWDYPPLRTLEHALKECTFAKDLKVLDNATVPIVKLKDDITKVSVDISFNTENGINAAELVNGYIRQYPALAPLVMLLKQFLLQRGLNEVFSGGLSSYALTLMIVSFLQLHPRNDARSENANFGVLLMEFFELYGHKFKYSTSAIRVGTNESKPAYVPKEEVLKIMGRGSRPLQSILCIEDPLKAGNDVARSSYAMSHVKQAFEYAYLVLHSSMLNCDRSRPPYVSRHRPYREESVLEKLISFPRVLHNYRRDIVSMFRFPPVFPQIINMCYQYPPQYMMLHPSIIPSHYILPQLQNGIPSQENEVHSAPPTIRLSSIDDDDESYCSDNSNIAKKTSENNDEKTDADDESIVSSPDVPDPVDNLCAEKLYNSPVSIRRHSTSHKPIAVVSPIVNSQPSKGVPQSISEPIISSSPVEKTRECSATSEIVETECSPVSDDTSINDPSSDSANVDISTDRETVLPALLVNKRSYASVVGMNSSVDRNDDCRQSVCSNDEVCDSPSISSGTSQDNGYSSYLSSDVGEDSKESSLSHCDGDESSSNPRVIKYNSSECRRATSSSRRSVSFQRRRSPSLPSHSSRDNPTGSWQQSHRRSRRKRTTNHSIPHVSSTTKSTNSVR